MKTSQNDAKSVGKEEIMEFFYQIDSWILMWIQSLRQDWMTPFWKTITLLGNAGYIWILLTVYLLLRPQLQKIGATVLLALLFGALVTNILFKPLFARIRPYEVIDGLVLLVDKQSDYSFPSGHSCAAFAAATVCWKMLPRPYGGSILLLAALMSFSRLYVGVHYPSDVLGGILIGTAAGFAAMKLIHGISCKKTLEKG